MTTEVMVKIPADLSSTHQNKWKREKIDSCIADLVRALQEGGIDMRGSCCGHGKEPGTIRLQDGRVLMITSDAYLYTPIRWFVHNFWQFAWDRICWLSHRPQQHIKLWWWKLTGSRS